MVEAGGCRPTGGSSCSDLIGLAAGGASQALAATGDGVELVSLTSDDKPVDGGGGGMSADGRVVLFRSDRSGRRRGIAGAGRHGRWGRACESHVRRQAGRWWRRVDVGRRAVRLVPI